jgi:hypothetical protein
MTGSGQYDTPVILLRSFNTNKRLQQKEDRPGSCPLLTLTLTLPWRR